MLAELELTNAGLGLVLVNTILYLNAIKKYVKKPHPCGVIVQEGPLFKQIWQETFFPLTSSAQNDHF